MDPWRGSFTHQPPLRSMAMSSSTPRIRPFSSPTATPQQPQPGIFQQPPTGIAQHLQTGLPEPAAAFRSRSPTRRRPAGTRTPTATGVCPPPCLLPRPATSQPTATGTFPPTATHRLHRAVTPLQRTMPPPVMERRSSRRALVHRTPVSDRLPPAPRRTRQRRSEGHLRPARVSGRPACHRLATCYPSPGGRRGSLLRRCLQPPSGRPPWTMQSPYPERACPASTRTPFSWHTGRPSAHPPRAGADHGCPCRSGSWPCSPFSSPGSSSTA